VLYYSTYGHIGGRSRFLGREMMPAVRDVIEVNGVQAFKHCANDEWHAADGNRPYDVYRHHDR
jgi:hypothetical protein